VPIGSARIQGLECFERVDDQAEGDSFGKGYRRSDEGEGNRERPRDVVEPVCREIFGFAQGRHRDTLGTGRALSLGNFDALVRFDMGSNRDPEVRGAVGHPTDVAVEDVEVEK